MAITTAHTTSGKQQYMIGQHNFTNSSGDAWKMPLYTSSATLSAATTAYSGTNEVANGSGYTTAGNTLTSVTPTTSGTTAYTDFSDTSWSTATFTARGCTIYNDTDSDSVVSVHDFGADKTATAGTFTVIFPTADASNAIIRIA